MIISLWLNRWNEASVVERRSEWDQNAIGLFFSRYSPSVGGIWGLMYYAHLCSVYHIISHSSNLCLAGWWWLDTLLGIVFSIFSSLTLNFKKKVCCHCYIKLLSVPCVLPISFSCGRSLPLLRLISILCLIFFPVYKFTIEFWVIWMYNWIAFFIA